VKSRYQSKIADNILLKFVLKSPENPSTTILHSEGCRSSFRIRPENIVEFYFRLIIMPITHQSGWSSWYGLSKRMGGGVFEVRYKLVKDKINSVKNHSQAFNSLPADCKTQPLNSN